MAHDHADSHAPTNFNRAFAIGTILNLLFVIIEAGYGTLSNSLALIADAGHNLSDVMTLLLAWGAMALANRSATAKHILSPKRIIVTKSKKIYFCPVSAIEIIHPIKKANTAIANIASLYIICYPSPQCP